MVKANEVREDTRKAAKERELAKKTPGCGQEIYCSNGTVSLLRFIK
jgi:hypothetical protein